MFPSWSIRRRCSWARPTSWSRFGRYPPLEALRPFRSYRPGLQRGLEPGRQAGRDRRGRQDRPALGHGQGGPGARRSMPTPTSCTPWPISPKGDVLATGGDDKLIKYWNVADGKELRKSEGHGAPIYWPGVQPRRHQAGLGFGRQDDPHLERRRRQGAAQARRPPRRRLLRSRSVPMAKDWPRSATAATCSSGTSRPPRRSFTSGSLPTP